MFLAESTGCDELPLYLTAYRLIMPHCLRILLSPNRNRCITRMVKKLCPKVQQRVLYKPTECSDCVQKQRFDAWCYEIRRLRANDAKVPASIVGGWQPVRQDPDVLHYERILEWRGVAPKTRHEAICSSKTLDRHGVDTKYQYLFEGGAPHDIPLTLKSGVSLFQKEAAGLC